MTPTKDSSPMSPNRRIFLNIIATYGRSLYALVCGLFISRWVLTAVGKSEFGLYGVVGGMTVIVMLAYTMRLVRGGIAAVMTQAPQKWYNMRYIDMSGSLPMRRRVENAKVRYSAAYPTGRERFCISLEFEV